MNGSRNGSGWNIAFLKMPHFAYGVFFLGIKKLDKRYSQKKDFKIGRNLHRNSMIMSEVKEVHTTMPGHHILLSKIKGKV